VSFFEAHDRTSPPQWRSPGRTLGFGEGFRAAFEEMQAGHVSHAPDLMMRAAEDERRAAIEAATGQPFVDAVRPFMPEGFDPVTVETGMAGRFDWEPVIDDLKANLSGDKARGIHTGDALRTRAGEIAYETEAAGVLARSRARGLAGEAGLVLGEIAGVMTDPINLLSLAAGAPAATGLLRFAVTEALIGGASEAAVQPFVQKWRGEAGLAELDPGLEIAMAAGGAGVLAGGGWMATAAGRAAWRKVKGLGAGDLALAHRELGPRANDEELAARAIVEQWDALPAAPEGVAPSDHLARLAEADRIARSREAPSAAADGEVSDFKLPDDREFDLAAGEGQRLEADQLETDLRAAIEAEGDFEVPVGAREDASGDIVVETLGARSELDRIGDEREFVDRLKICLGGQG
jgi:hypothetical protein